MAFELKQNILVAADAVVFGYDKTGLYVVLIERKHPDRGMSWALPGGFVEDDEDLETAAIRELEEETGVKVKFMKQFHTFGAVKRDSRKRVIAVAHYILIKKGGVNPRGTDDARTAQWVAIDKVPKLAFDHDEMLEMALDNLRKSVASLDIDCIHETPSLDDVKLLGKLL